MDQFHSFESSVPGFQLNLRADITRTGAARREGDTGGRVGRTCCVGRLRIFLCDVEFVAEPRSYPIHAGPVDVVDAGDDTVRLWAACSGAGARLDEPPTIGLSRPVD